MAERLPRILAIDDTPANLLALGAALGPEFDLQMVTSGEMGLAQAFETPPDLILLDMIMPGMDGFETCRRLQADPITQNIPIIFMTAYDSQAAESRGLEAGAEDFISNPINPDVLRARVRIHLTIKRQADLLRSMAFVDGLTGIANRRRFDEALDSEWRACRRSGTPLSLILIDIDQFKQFNDAQGHQAGDACLKAISTALQACSCRPRDLLARYGGEEFIDLLPSTDLAGAQVKAEEFRQIVEGLGIPHMASSVAPIVTISMGIATVIPTVGLCSDQLVAAADERLYDAKRSGRNRVSCAELGSVQQ